MNHLRYLAGLSLLLPLATGCAGRTAPFNEMDQAQVTVLRLSQAPAPTPVTPAATTGIPGLPAIPGVPAEWTAAGQQILQGAQQMLPPGMIPPGILPGTQAGQAQPQQQQQVPLFKGFAITAQMPLTDDKLKDELFDIFGHEGNFNSQRGNCFTPGLGISIARPNSPQPVELLVSFSCNQAVGDGFRWPYPSNGFTTETRDRLGKVYEKLFGPIPPGA
ncbi:MAG: hypothetical protein U0359_23970 [Byssovorax sp.]